MSKFKIPFLLVTLTLGFVLLSANSAEQTASSEEEIDIAQISEAFGHLIGKNLDAPGFSFDVDGIIRGIKSAVKGEESPMSEEEYARAITMIQERAFSQMAAENLDLAEEFLEDNQRHTGIVALEEGKLQYRVDKEGSGAPVESDATPLVHYTGRYIDGQVFGTSADGEPVALPLDQTIPGFSKGIVGMCEGEKRTLFVHPDLGYGTSGHLAPNSLLVFEVEVVQASQDLPE